MSNLCLMIVTVDSGYTAKEIADRVIKEKLAVSAHFNPTNSIYWWAERIWHENEFELALRTTADKVKQLEAMVKELHPYETPEILIIKAEGFIAEM